MNGIGIGIGTADGDGDENNGCDVEMGRRQGTRVCARRSWTSDG